MSEAKAPVVEEIAFHHFVNGHQYCAKCGRNREDLVSYGAPGMCKTGDSGLSCSGGLTDKEVGELQAAYQKRLATF